MSAFFLARNFLSDFDLHRDTAALSQFIEFISVIKKLPLPSFVKRLENSLLVTPNSYSY